MDMHNNALLAQRPNGRQTLDFRADRRCTLANQIGRVGIFFEVHSANVLGCRNFNWGARRPFCCCSWLRGRRSIRQRCSPGAAALRCVAAVPGNATASWEHSNTPTAACPNSAPHEADVPTLSPFSALPLPRCEFQHSPLLLCGPLCSSRSPSPSASNPALPGNVTHAALRCKSCLKQIQLLCECLRLRAALRKPVGSACTHSPRLNAQAAPSLRSRVTKYVDGCERNLWKKYGVSQQVDFPAPVGCPKTRRRKY